MSIAFYKYFGDYYHGTQSAKRIQRKGGAFADRAGMASQNGWPEYQRH
jgi:hypothetical protein